MLESLGKSRRKKAAQSGESLGLSPTR